MRAPALVWLLRALWLTLPLTAGPLFADALADRLASFRTAASVGLWTVWAVVLAATLVPRDVTLTAVRVAAPGAVVAAGWAALASGSSGSGGSTVAAVVGLVAALATAAVAFLASVGDTFVDGSSYGSERRMALRPPTALLLGPVELVWAAVVGGLVAGPMLLAADRWVAGGAALLVGWPVAGLGLRSLHRLARRWVVFVPAGMVLHDPLSIDAVLFPRRSVAALGPAQAGTTAVDTGLNALGLALELRLTEPVTIPVPGTRRRAKLDPRAATVETDRLLFTPTRPGPLLIEARKRRLPVGATP